MPVAEMLPTAGLMDQVTAVLVAFATVALKSSVCEVVNETEPGVIVTLTGGVSVIVTLAAFAVLATLVAVTVTLCESVIVAGAV